MFASIQKNNPRQIIISTHSSEILQDEGIGLDEVLLLIPSNEGTKVESANEVENAAAMLKKGLTLADVVLPPTSPKNAIQLTLFGI
jgi:hypothetical protein